MSLPVTRVIVMEDRAQVERRGEVVLAGPSTRVELTGVAPVAVDRSIKVEVQGGRFLDAKVERTWRQQPRGGLPEDASALRRRVHALEDEVKVADDEVTRLETGGELLAAARSDLLRAIAEGSGHGRADPAGWSEHLATLTTRQAARDEGAREARIRLDSLRRLRAEAAVALSASEEPRSALDCRIVLTLAGEGTAQVRVTYLVPCAVWRPAYRASLEGEAVRFEAEAVVWQRTGEDWNDVELQLSTARPTLGTTPPRLSEDRLSTRPKLTEEKRVVDVAIREEVIQSAGETGGAAELPGLDDGGEARLLQASGRTSIPSDGQPHRVPLFSFESPATLERVCPAELTRLVSLVSRFPNTSGQVLLAGPVDLVRQAGFVGRSQLKFAAPGELVKLSFGSEDGLQIIRSFEETLDEARLTGRRTTTRKVTLHVSNARPEAARVVIEERLPVSEVKEVEVQVRQRGCDPAPSTVSKDGVARIEVDLPPNGTRTATFSWELAAASKVAGV